MNALAKFTPGPWKIQFLGQAEADLINRGTFMGLNAGSGAPAILDADDEAVWEANAHLAAAAPCMFEALVEARTQVEVLQARLGINDSGSGTLSIIDAALSKAVASRSSDALTIREGDAL